MLKKLRLVPVYFALFCLTLSLPISAQTLPDETLPIESKGLDAEYNYKGEFLKMIFMLGGVILVIFVLLKLTKSLMNKRLYAANHSNLIKILEKRTLSPKSHLYAIGVLDRLLIISESPTGVQSLGDFPAGTHLEAKYKLESEKS